GSSYPRLILIQPATIAVYSRCFANRQLPYVYTRTIDPTGSCHIYTQHDRARSAFPNHLSVPAPPPERKQETLVLHWFALFASLGTLGEDRTNQVSSWLNFAPLLPLNDPRRGSSLLVI
ncbi:hypothetical protein EJB05_49538, partial [Eragrostis curvula]